MKLKDLKNPTANIYFLSSEIPEDIDKNTVTPLTDKTEGGFYEVITIALKSTIS